MFGGKTSLQGATYTIFFNLSIIWKIKVGLNVLLYLSYIHTLGAFSIFLQNVTQCTCNIFCPYLFPCFGTKL